MKYGVISYRRPVRPGSGVHINLGDSIQELAVLNIYKNMGIQKEDIVFIDRYHMGSYTGGYVVVPICCFNQITNMYGYEYDTLPPSPRILPVYISFHLHTRLLSGELVNHLRLHQPIGCRDEETMLNLRKHGIECYLSGCITATFPQRKETKQGNQVIFIDAPKSLDPYIPAQFKKRTTHMQHMPSYKRQSNEKYLTFTEREEILTIAKERLRMYAEKAELIVTSRLHAAVPALAMGIPVILARENIDGRFSWIDKYIPIYEPEQFSQINWRPEPIDYEEQKEKIVNIFQNEVQNKYNRNYKIYEISEFYENRSKSTYNKRIKEFLRKEFLRIGNKKHRFSIWGLSPVSEIIIHCMYELFEDGELKLVIDRYVEGDFYGVPIVKPENLKNSYEDMVFIIVPQAVREEAENWLKKNSLNYIVYHNMSDGKNTEGD